MKNSARFILIAYLFSWLVWSPAILSTRGLIGEIPWPPLFAIGTCGPLVAAIWCLWRADGWSAVKDWLKKGFSSRVFGLWWLFILLVPFVIPILVMVIYRLSSGDPYPLQVFQNPWLALTTVLLMVTIGGGLEEYGWRGYLLGRLQERLSLWQSDLILIMVHSLWHLPLFFIASTAQSTYPFWIFLIFGGGFTLLINQLYRKTDGSLLAAILFHGLVNSGLDLFPLVGPIVDHANWPLLLAGGLYAFLALALRFWKRPSIDSFGHNTTGVLPIELGNEKLQ